MDLLIVLVGSHVFVAPKLLFGLLFVIWILVC